MSPHRLAPAGPRNRPSALGIVYPDEIEAVGGCRDTGFGTVSSSDDCRKIACGKATAADLDQRSDDVSDHMPEKPVGLEFERDDSTLRGNVATGHVSDRAGGNAPMSAK